MDVIFLSYYQYINSLPLTESLPTPQKKAPRKKLTISLREEPPGSRHLVSTIDPKTKEKVPIRGILRVKLSSNQPATVRSESQSEVTIPSYSTTKEEKNDILSAAQRILDSKPRSLTLIDPETNSLDDSNDADGLQILTTIEPKTSNALFTPVSRNTELRVSPTKDSSEDTASEPSVVSSTDEEDAKKKKKKRPTSSTIPITPQLPTTANANTANSIINRKRPSAFSNSKTPPQTPISNAPMKFRKPTPPKRNEPVEPSESSVTTYSNLTHRLSKTSEPDNTNYSYTGSLAPDTALFVKATGNKQRSLSPGVNIGSRTNVSRNPVSSTLLQPTISSTLKNDPTTPSSTQTKKRPQSAPKSRPKDEDVDPQLYNFDRNNLKSSFGGAFTTTKSTLQRPMSSNVEVSSSLNSKRTLKPTSTDQKPGGSRLMRPTLSFLSKTVKKN